MAEEARSDTTQKSNLKFYLSLGLILAICIIGAVITLVYALSSPGRSSLSDASQNPGGSTPVLIQPTEADRSRQSLSLNVAYKNPPAIYSLKTKTGIIVPLKFNDSGNVGGGGYAKLNVSLIPSDKNVIAEISAKEDIIMQIINETVSDFTAAELQGVTNRQRVRNIIMANINSILNDGRVEGIIFNTFVIQYGSYG